MADFWKSLEDTARSLGGAVAAPYGLAIDLATAPFDDKDDDFGSIVNRFAENVGDVLDPIMNEDTWTGWSFGKTMEGLEYVYREGISEPLATAGTVAGHVAYTRNLGEFASPEAWSKAYKVAQNRSIGQTFAVGSTAVSGNVFGWEDDKGKRFVDPMNPDAYKQLWETTNFGATMVSGTTDFVARWYLDPGIILGKAASGYRARVQFRDLKPADRIAMFDKMMGEEADRLTGLAKSLRFLPGAKQQAGFQSRTDAYLKFINGENHLKRQLNAAEIWAASPELRRSAQGRTIAGLLADAEKLDPTDIGNAQRRILSVAGGDLTQIERLRSEIGGAAYLADALDNIRRGGVVDLERLAMDPLRQYDPALYAKLEAQLDNLNTKGDIDKFYQDFLSGLDDVTTFKLSALRTDFSLNQLPGVHRQGVRGLKRETGTHGKIMGGVNTKVEKITQRAEEYAQAEGVSGVFQKSLHHVPVVTVKTAGLVASPWTKFPKAVSDALRQTHYVGVADLHDWNGAITQLDSMLRVVGVDDITRAKEVGKAYGLFSEAEKMRVIGHIENVAMKHLATTYGRKLGKEIDTDFIEQLMMKGSSGRAQSLGSIRGRAYAATEMPDDMLALRGAGMQRAQEQATTAASSTSFGATKTADTKWRIDHLDDNGTPLALPLLSTQLANSVPLMDVHLAKKVLEREKNVERLGTLSRAWREEARDLAGLQEKLARAKARLAAGPDRQNPQGLERLIRQKQQAMDALVDAGQTLTRVWKFSVLFRLGYPIRVLMDDHWRIWTQLSALPFYTDNGAEATRAWWDNRAPAFLNGKGRKAEAVRAYQGAKAQRRMMLDTEYGYDKIHSADDFDQIVGAVKVLRSSKATAAQKATAEEALRRLDPDYKIAAYYHRAADITKTNRQVGAKRGAITKWQKQIDDAETKASLGIDPGVDIADLKRKIKDTEDLIREKQGALAYLTEQQPSVSPGKVRDQIENIESMIDAGAKAFRKGVRTIGTEDVKLPGGWSANGAFAGPYGKAYLSASSSSGTFQQQVWGMEDTARGMGSVGSWRTIQVGEPGHLEAWADVLNHQIKMSPEAMFFVKGGDVDGFVRWLREPAQAHLRERVSHFAHDPEDWGHRIQALVRDYLPTDDLRGELVKGHISARRLNKLFDPSARPAVHGQVVSYNLGRNAASEMISKATNRVYKFLGEMPTDKLSRHPYFNSLYKQELRELHAVRQAQKARMGLTYTQDDIVDLERIARQKALAHLKQTLFDMSAHSHAAHVMRFVSPFFAAHQESLTRWWRIAQENPAVIRRFQQAFDMPRKMGLVYDVETGEPVGDGESISPKHRILIRVPTALGGESTRLDKWIKKMGGDKYWSVNENGFNLILQGGLMNPGTGPLVSFPVEALVARYADEAELEKVARILNPYPPDSPWDVLQPAWFQRAVALVQKDESAEWSQRYSSNFTELYVQFKEAHGREPSDSELDKMGDRAGKETNRDVILMWMNNMFSPNPAKPESKYATVQHGWYQIRNAAVAEGHDFEWMLDQFREKYGDIYLAMVYSDSLNPARLQGTRGEVSAMQVHANLLNDVDPKLARMIIGPDAAKMAEEDETLGEYSYAARNWQRNRRVDVGSTQTYVDTKEPKDALMGTMIRNGWDEYAKITTLLTAVAEQRGLQSYAEDMDLVRAKSIAVARLKQENFAWAEDYDDFAKGKYNSYLLDMQQIASNSKLDDTERPDIAVLRQYLELRSLVATALEQRQKAGLPYTETAVANAPLMKAFYLSVERMKEQSSYFEEYHYNGIIEHDPFIRAGEEAITGGQNG